MIKKALLVLMGVAALTACDNPAANKEEEKEDVIDLKSEDEGLTTERENDAPESYEKGGLKIYPFEGFEKYPDSKLTLNAPNEGMKQDGNKVKFDFTVEGYDLGTQTPGAGENGLANSGNGQHIHLIIDNDPYSAHYEPKFEKEVEPGHHVAIAFLSRSFHLSVKNDNAYKVFQFTAGGEDMDMQPLDLDKPMLFYSRPKGEYAGEDAKKVLFDFYVVNGELQPDGYSVITTINDSLDFEFDTWQPYVIEGLPMGENTINIKLVDAQGNTVDSKMNNVTRKFTLKE